MKSGLIAAAAIAVSAVPNATNAATLVVGGGWQTFYFGGTGSAIRTASGDTAYSFTLAQAAELHIVDAFSIGDTFRFFNFGTLLGSTGAFDPGGPTTTDAATAFAGNTYSKLSVLLAPGSYSLSGVATASPYGTGGAYIKLAPATRNAVPEPATWVMIISGYLLVGAVMRYRGRTFNAGYY